MAKRAVRDNAATEAGTANDKVARQENWDSAAANLTETSPDAAESKTKAAKVENELGDTVTIQVEERGPAK
jgi:hypothetical protein